MANSTWPDITRQQPRIYSPTTHLPPLQWWDIALARPRKLTITSFSRLEDTLQPSRWLDTMQAILSVQNVTDRILFRTCDTFRSQPGFV
jgi:hypothetical protein